MIHLFETTWWTLRRSITAAAALAVGYLVLATLTFWIASNGEAAFFPAAGLTFGVLLIVPVRRWWMLAAVIFIAELGLDLFNGLTFRVSIMLAVANTIEPIIAATIIRRTGAGVRHETLGDIGRFAGAGIVSTTLSGLIGGAGVSLIAGGAFAKNVLAWQSGDSIGQLIVAPLVLAVVGVIPRHQRGRYRIELNCCSESSR